MTIHRLLYRSDMDLIGTEAVIGQQVTEIVRLSAERNAAHGLTGALLYTRGVFIQALERFRFGLSRMAGLHEALPR